MINFDNVVKENITENNPNLPQIFDHICRILINGGSWSGKTNSLFNLVNHQPDTDKIHLYAKAKYQFLMKKQQSTGLNHFNDSKGFIEYSNNMNGIYWNIEEYNPNKKRKILIVFDDTIADMINYKKLNQKVTETFMRDKKLNIFIVYITQP